MKPLKITGLANSTERICAECHALSTGVQFNPIKLGALTI